MKQYLSDKFNFFTPNTTYGDLILIFISFLLSLRCLSWSYNELFFNIYSAGTIILSVIFIIKQLFRHSDLRISLFSVIFSAFLILAIVVTVFSSVFYFPANKGISLYLAYILLLWSFTFLSSEEKGKLKVLLNITAGLIVLQYWGLCFISSAYYFQYGLLMNKSLLANFLVIYLFLFLYGRKINSYTYFVIGILVLTVIATGARTSIIALLAGSMIVLLGKIKRPLSSLLLGGVITITGIVITVLYYLRPDSVKGRILLWKSFLSGTDTKTFFIGKGIDSTAYKAQLYLEHYLMDASLQEKLLAGSTFSPMNEYIRILIENGILGLSLFIVSLLMLCYSFFIRKQAELLAGCIVLMISCLFSYPLHSPAIWFLLLFIGSYYIGKEKLIIFNSKTKIICSLIMGVFAIFMIIKMSAYDNALIQWYSLRGKKDYLYNEPYFTKRYESLYPRLNDNPLFLTDYGIKLQELSRHEKAVEIMDRAKTIEPTPERYMLLGYGYEQLHKYDTAEYLYKKAIQTQPKLFRPRYLLFNLYRQLNKTDLAKKEASDILLFPIKVQSKEVREIRDEVTRYLDQF
ncbi:O-antigen ligase family protein [Elizabethkingia anophelis]|nr:O-antigen ligase family protein [Elizabethkingia anophelis]